ncbi:class C sortase [Paenibacillus sp. FSL H8-0548]|uniref:class D sortase n=1 Tax=Paenibacillus sp. FSL H8-0548 TaxID=1920422 RepID=UPI00096D4B1A|nr:class D sortase [Paenibacillus sp. FSL H8-0548]OMF31797.1 class C sortase [Paenibacillus sp. FSL H8-0548]
MKKIWSYTLVVIGILILLYPKASEWYDSHKQEKLMAEWEEASFDETAEEQAQQQYERLTELFYEEAVATEPAVVSTPTEAPTAAPVVQKIASIATIKIDKIKLKLPVVEGATQKNMKSATAHLKETAAIGQVGNAAIAGHRMRAKGRLFNRLGEVAVGDKIVVETKDETYSYTVYKVSIVEPTDVSVLNYNDKDKLLTLITCDPIVDPTHRLIIHAKM